MGFALQEPAMYIAMKTDLASRPFYKYLRSGLDGELEASLLSALGTSDTIVPSKLLKGAVMGLDRRVDYKAFGRDIVTYEDVSGDQTDALHRARGALVRSLLTNDYRTAFGAALLCCPTTARQLAAASTELNIGSARLIAQEAQGILSNALKTSLEYGSTVKPTIARSLATVTSLLNNTQLPEMKPYVRRDYQSGRVQGYDPQPGDKLISRKPTLIDKVREAFGRLRSTSKIASLDLSRHKTVEPPQWKQYRSARLQGHYPPTPLSYGPRSARRDYVSENVKASRTPGLFSRLFAYGR